MRRRGFTLVEVLVTLGVLVVLAAFLLPALGRARESARHTFCMNNMRQIGTAFVTTFPDHYPHAEGWVYWEQGQQLSRSPLYDNLGGRKDPVLFTCPSDDIHRHPRVEWLGEAQYPYSYTVNDLICRRGREQDSLPSLRAVEVAYPSQKILLIDENTETADDAAWNWRESLTKGINVLSDRHDPAGKSAGDKVRAGRGNVIFCDGHGEAVDRGVMLEAGSYDPFYR